MRSNRKYLLAIAALAVLVALAHYLSDGGEPPQVNNCAPALLRTPQSQGQPHQPPAEPPPVASPGPNPATVDGPRSPESVSVRISAPSGEPVAGVPINWVHNGARYTRQGRSDTGPDGTLKLAGLGAGKLRLESTDDEWQLPDERLDCTPDQVLVVQAQRCLAFKLLAVLKDGSYFKGNVKVSQLDPVKPYKRWMREVYLDGVNPAEVRGGPLGFDISFHFRESVLGYAAQSHTVEKDRITPGCSLLINLEPGQGPARGLLEVDFTGFQRAVSRIEYSSLNSLMRGGLVHERVSKTVWRTKPILPGIYMVRIQGKAYWESGAIEVRADATTVVVPDAYLPASVSVKVMDEEGKPLPRALLTRNTEDYNTFAVPVVAVGGMLATSGTEGYAELTGLRAGTLNLVVEAEGYEPQQLRIELAAGESKPAIPVYLSKARGKMTVRLKGMRDGTSYTLIVTQPGGTVLKLLKSAGAESTFEAMPLRQYAVAVAAGRGGGGTVAQCLVILTASSSDVTVELDVSALEERQTR